MQQLLLNDDIAMMDDEKSLSCFTTVQKKKINWVQLYLGVMYLSKISTLNGESLTEGINNGNKEFIQYTNLFAHPV